MKHHLIILLLSLTTTLAVGQKYHLTFSVSFKKHYWESDYNKVSDKEINLICQVFEDEGYILVGDKSVNLTKVERNERGITYWTKTADKIVFMFVYKEGLWTTIYKDGDGHMNCIESIVSSVDY